MIQESSLNIYRQATTLLRHKNKQIYSGVSTASKFKKKKRLQSSKLRMAKHSQEHPPTSIPTSFRFMMHHVYWKMSQHKPSHHFFAHRQHAPCRALFHASGIARSFPGALQPYQHTPTLLYCFLDTVYYKWYLQITIRNTFLVIFNIIANGISLLSITQRLVI